MRSKILALSMAMLFLAACAQRNEHAVRGMLNNHGGITLAECGTGKVYWVRAADLLLSSLMGNIQDLSGESGAGVVGEWAARTALGFGSHVIVLDNDLGALRGMEHYLDRRITTAMATEQYIRQAVTRADVVIGAMMTVGQRAPMLVSEEMVASMRPRWPRKTARFVGSPSTTASGLIPSFSMRWRMQ